MKKKSFPRVVVRDFQEKTSKFYIAVGNEEGEWFSSFPFTLKKEAKEHLMELGHTVVDLFIEIELSSEGQEINIDKIKTVKVK